MAHLLDSIAFVGDTPWHGFGNRLPEKQSIEVWAEQAGMNWNICEAPVNFSARGVDGSNETVACPESKVLYRSDNNVPLSVVSQRYKVVQPSEILEFYRDLTDQSGYELETAGILKGGRKIWALARTGQSSTIKTNDVTYGYILLATACDGTLATTAQFTSIRVVCNNTLAVALAGGSGAVKVKHSTTFDPLLVKRQLGISVATWDSFMYGMKALSERKVTSSEAAGYIRRVFSGPQAAPPSANERGMNAVLALFNGHGHGAELDSSKGTAFGLLNSITEFVDHQRRARSSEYRLESAWFGQGAVLKTKAHCLALEMIQ